MQTNHLTKQLEVLTLRQQAKDSNTGSFLHTSASTNGLLIIGFLQSRYQKGREGYVPTKDVIAFMNQSQVHVAKQLAKLHEAGLIKRTIMWGGRGTPYGWSAKP